MQAVGMNATEVIVLIFRRPAGRYFPQNETVDGVRSVEGIAISVGRTASGIDGPIVVESRVTLSQPWTDYAPAEPGKRGWIMPAKKKILVGGSIAGLVLSLALPVSQNGGLSSTSSEVAAGVRPKFSKPWHVEKNRTGQETVKSYPLPEHLKEGYTGEMPADPGAPPSEVMQELQQIYRENGNEAPQMGDGDLTVQEAGLRRERERAERQEREEKSGNAFTRFFDRLTGRENNRHTVKSYPMPENPGKEKEARQNNVAPENLAGSVPAPLPPEPKQLKPKQPPMLPLPKADNAPVAEVIIPPQPQPNLLPGMDFREPEAIKPMITQGVETSNPNDPFPLPPLPEGFEKKQEKMVQAQPKPAAQTQDGSFSLPPLPGFGDSPAPQTAQIAEPAAAEPVQEKEQPNAHPLSEPAEPLHIAKEAVEAETVEAEEELMAEALAMPETAAEPISEEAETEEAAVAELDEAPKAKPSGEVATSLPLAPSSAAGNRWETRDSAPAADDQLAEDDQLPTGGWRSRTHNDVSREPNTLNIPAEARPAELPAPRTANAGNHADKYRRIAERGERTGFKGFCPVALKDYLELVDASPEFRTEFEGQVYYFASQTHMNYFQADPLRYVPAQGGIDLVKYLEEGSSEPGRLDFAVWYQDRLFLFSSSDTLETFRAEPGKFIK